MMPRSPEMRKVRDHAQQERDVLVSARTEVRHAGHFGTITEQARDDAEKAGLIHRREDDAGLIIMAAAGGAAAPQ